MIFINILVESLQYHEINIYGWFECLLYQAAKLLLKNKRTGKI